MPMIVIIIIKFSSLTQTFAATAAVDVSATDANTERASESFNKKQKIQI